MIVGSSNEAEAMKNLSKIPSPGEIGWTYAKYNLFQPLFKHPFLPKALLIYVTYRCNARCSMCGIWKDHEFSDAKTELSVADLDRILSDTLFSKVEYVNINGGEPTLRSDLLDIVRLILKKFPHLKHLSMNSNGLLSSRLASSVEQMLALCRQRGIRFSLVISFHGTEDLLDNIFGVPDAFQKLQRSLAALSALDGQDEQFLSLNCVITSMNAANLYELQEWCELNKMRINFILGEVRDRFFNQDTVAQTVVSGETKKETIGFLRHLTEDMRLTNPVALRYHCLANMLENGEKRTLACHYAMGGLILGSHGTLYYCPHSRAIGNCRRQSAYDIYYGEENLSYRELGLMDEKCRHCPPNTFNRLEFQKDIFRFLRFFINPRWV
jgi:MoaA/NifB/PqqE/SkfB family radical SAM enzyme